MAMLSLRPRLGRGGRDHGAEAVEFALLMLPLLILLIGIINYGLWYSDSLSLREGVRESAREAVVETLAPGCGVTFTLAAVACGTRAQIGAPGRSYAKVVLGPTGWVQGQEVVVCGMVKAINFTGFVPLPAGGFIESETAMSIESVAALPTDAPSYADTLPTGVSWAWCTNP